MTHSFFHITRCFFAYQKERFPLLVLVITLFPAVLSSGVVASPNSNLFEAFLALVASLAYLFHIRVIDEYRDFSHDSIHHTSRPLQVGLIHKEELRGIDILGVCVFLGIAGASSLTSFFLASAMLLYSYFAGKEFFLGDVIRRRFFLYNSGNLFQMLLMQLFVYSVFVGSFSFSPLLFMHFLFTTTGTVIFEFIRKLKIPGDDGTGNDTYTSHIGFRNSILVYSLLVCVNAFFFFKSMQFFSNSYFLWLMISFFFALILVVFAACHFVFRRRLSDQLLQLSFVVGYGTFNLLIYFITFF